MGKRIITTENLEEDIKIEGQLRPQHLTEYIGQEKAKKTLGIYIEAAKARERLWIMCFLWSSRTRKDNSCRNYRQ